MSQKDEIKPEFKTVRIPAAIYFKLAELAGLIAIIRGENTSISEVTSTAISTLHDGLYPYFMNVIKNQSTLQKFRTEYETNKKQLNELIKDIKILE